MYESEVDSRRAHFRLFTLTLRMLFDDEQKSSNVFREAFKHSVLAYAFLEGIDAVVSTR